MDELEEIKKATVYDTPFGKLSIIKDEKREYLISKIERLKETSGCLYAGKGRGDCEYFIGLPGKSIPGQHDGEDDTVDVYGKPNGWCWSCWKSYQIERLRKKFKTYGNHICIIENGSYKGICEALKHSKNTCNCGFEKALKEE